MASLPALIGQGTQISAGNLLTILNGKELFIKTSTGDVEGSLLADKVFIVNTDTGEVDVPKTTSGGKCEIKTDTGDVEINIVK